MSLDSVKFTNDSIAHLLRSIAAAHEIKESNRFRIIAYQNAADAVEHLNREINDIWQEGKLNEVRGIGQIIGQALDEYFRKGYSRHFRSVFKNIPETTFELMKVPLLGPKRAYILAKKLNLKNMETLIEDLKKACLDDKVAKIPGFGKKSQELILKSLMVYKKSSEHRYRMPLPYAFELAKQIEDYIRTDKNVGRVDMMGSLRRMVSTIGDVDIVAQVTSNKKQMMSVYKDVIEHFVNYPKKLKIENSGLKKASIIVAPNIRVDLRVQNEKSYGAMLQYFTGSKSHNIKLREYALKRGLSLSEYGIKEIRNSKSVIHKFKNEESLYDFLKLQYIPPELREGEDEIDIAKEKKIPQLVNLKDIRGDLHTHASYDLKPSHDAGKNTYAEICEKADELGYDYVGFSDHNPKISHLDSEEIVNILRKRKESIEKIREKTKTKFFIGLEVDILPDGRVAVPEKGLNYLDYIIVSVHSSFGMEKQAMTKRVLKALQFPKVKILAHPTGRLLNRREGYELEWEKIFAEAKGKNVAIEINAWPERLDLPDTLVRSAKGVGVRFAINSDAHANYQMENMFYGVSVARRGWCEKRDIINTLPYKEFRKWLTD